MTIVVAILGVVALVAEAFLAHRRDQREVERVDAIHSAVVDHEHRLQGIERWRGAP